jgi:hypothetical protein
LHDFEANRAHDFDRGCDFAAINTCFLILQNKVEADGSRLRGSEALLRKSNGGEQKAAERTARAKGFEGGSSVVRDRTG